jgi:hypothetical protein
MSLLRTSRLHLLVAFVALFGFSGDIVADSIIDARGEHCAAQTCPSDSGHEKTPCSHCSCAVHNGTFIAANSGVHVSDGFEAFAFVLTSDQVAPVGLAAAIDHPPQLS